MTLAILESTVNISDFSSRSTGAGVSELQRISAQDSTNFSTMIGGGGSLSNMRAETLAVSERAAKHSIKTAQQRILMAVVDQKNAMLLESRGSSAKKTTEISKEIGF